MLPSPPITTATTSSSENPTVYAPGLTAWATKHRTAPPSPAATELAVNASTLTRPAGMPLSRAATSSSRTACIRSPNRPPRSTVSPVTTTAATTTATIACHCSSAMTRRSASGTPSKAVCTPWSPCSTVDQVEATAGRATTTASVSPARYGPDRRAAARPSSSPTTALTSAPASRATTNRATPPNGRALLVSA